MRSRFVVCLVATPAVMSLAFGVNAQETSLRAPENLLDYRIVQYASTKGTSPYQVMGYDNNGDVLLACRSAKTKTQLQEMGVPFTESQILLLDIYDLLSVEGDALTTAFPILDPDQTLQIRGYAKKAASDVMRHVRPEIVEFLGLLSGIGGERTAYSILFAYVFDGMVWGDFQDRGLIQPRKIDVEHPLWAGEVYAFYPHRSFSCGTNTFSSGPLTLYLNWSRPVNRLLGPFYRVIRELDDAAFEDFVEKGFVEDEAIKDAFAPFGVFDEVGRLTIPVIEETRDGALYRVSRRISATMAERTLAVLSFEDLKTEFGFRDAQQALVIVFHELIWDLMDAVEAEGLVQKPQAFSNAEEATSKDVADLMFVVRRPVEH